MGAEIPGATWIPNNNCFVGRNGLKPSYIILHGTAGGISAKGVAQEFINTQGGGNPVSSHIIIDQQGNIVQAVSLADGAWANGYLSAGHDPWWGPQINPNNVTISIEHVKSSQDNSDALTPEQQASSFATIAFICSRWNIPMRLADADGGVTGHFSIDPVNRSHCPGAYPWDQLWSFLNSGGGTVKHIEQAAQDTWNSTAHLFGGTPLPYNTGIAKAWHDLYINQQRTMPPPTTREFKSVDWSGNAIIVQVFGNMRCEWDGNAAHWFKTGI